MQQNKGPLPKQFLFISFIFLQALDILSTYQGVIIGGHKEANRLAVWAWLKIGFWPVAFLKIVLSMLAIWLFFLGYDYFGRKKNLFIQAIYVFFLWAAFGLTLGVVLNNFLILLFPA